MRRFDVRAATGRSQIVEVLTLVKDRAVGWLDFEIGDDGWRVGVVAGDAYVLDGEPPPASLAADEALTARFGVEAAHLIEVLASDERVSLRFVASEAGELGSLPSALPLIPLLAEASTHRLQERELWHAIGGRHARVKLVAAPELSEAQLDEVAESSHALLAQLLHPRPVSDLVGDRAEGAETLCRLVQLQSLGLVRTLGDGDPEAAATLSRSSLDLFLGRVGRDLAARPLEESPAAHCHQLARILRNVGIWNCYELLGVDRHDDEGTIHRGYVGVAKLSHPSQAKRLGLEEKDAALYTIFEAATQAYLTLSHPDRRKEYDRDLGHEIDEPHSEQRREEKAALARDMYQRAGRMILEEQYQPVLEVMQQAIQLDPQAEYYILLAEVQARNPKWQAGALASYRNAVRCRPDDADLRLKFARALEETGDLKQAGIQYRAALEIEPNDSELQARLESFEESAEPEQRGLMASLKTLFQRGD